MRWKNAPHVVDPTAHATRRPLVQPPGGIEAAAENLGEHLTGEFIENSPYEVSARACALHVRSNRGVRLKRARTIPPPPPSHTSSSR